MNLIIKDLPYLTCDLTEAYVALIKARFNNLGVEETIKFANQFTRVTYDVLDKHSTAE